MDLLEDLLDTRCQLRSNAIPRNQSDCVLTSIHTTRGHLPTEGISSNSRHIFSATITYLQECDWPHVWPRKNSLFCELSTWKREVEQWWNMLLNSRLIFYLPVRRRELEQSSVPGEGRCHNVKLGTPYSLSCYSCFFNISWHNLCILIIGE